MASSGTKIMTDEPIACKLRVMMKKKLEDEFQGGFQIINGFCSADLLL